MKSTREPLSKTRSKKTEEKTSGETPGKPRAITKFSRKDKQVPADRGAYEKRTTTQGSE
ncbi:MAG: hypothetical protein H0X66_17445 [Verrucomicrobia bacterium]|nr:hypothetical protein [Verrucomicrobiota bacterium]